MGLVKANNFTQPECTLTLDLSKSLEELKKDFSESTRYNIGWVERKGVKVESRRNTTDIEIFLRLLEQTSTRQGFKLNAEEDYYKKQYKVFEQAGMAKLYLAYEPQSDGGEVLASAIVVKFGRTVTYLHAASSPRNPKLRAPYLMQWKIIVDAKDSGAEVYDFWGVSPSDDPKDSWAGVTAFKKGFGGTRVCYSLPYDLVLNKKYFLDVILEKMRLITRKWR
jgi:lipid II:glycine glycyltransferase (peptidoglycan interpeptide bridge formation enzyme)